MAFADLLDHDVYILRDTDTGSEDDYGQPVQTIETTHTFKAAIQPRTAREVALSTGDGAPIGDHIVFMLPRVVSNSDVIIHDSALCPKAAEADLPDGRYEIVGERNAAGRGHHLELDTRLVGWQAGVEGS